MTSPKLTLGTSAPDVPFRLPLDLVTQSIAILAKRGVGKTYTAAVLCEEIHAAGAPLIIIDPTGAHWGLKSSADGKRAGLPFVVFGGEHADLPLDDGAGEVIARAIVAKRFPAIIDLSLLRKGQIHRFLVAFFEALYRLNRQALHLVCDEADVYAPQKPFGEEARTLGAMQDIVRRGRIRGLGCTLITQRPQVLNKDVLTQCEVLIAMRLVHPKDIGAIEEWVAVHGDPKQATAMISSLPSLPVGHAWFWSPGFEDLFARVAIRRRRTFDSSATPKPGESLNAPEEFATFDIATLGEELAAAATAVKENDPAELRREITRLKAEAAAAKPDHAALEQARNEGFAECRARTAKAQGRIATELAVVKKAVDDLQAFVAQITTPGGPLMNVQAMERRPQSMPPVERFVGILAPKSRSNPNGIPPAAREANLSKAERYILTCLAQFGDCSKARVAAITGYAVNGGGFNNALSALRTAGYILEGDPVRVRPEGIAALGSYTPLPTGPELVRYWEAKLAKAEAAIFRYLCAQFPVSATKEEIASATGYDAAGGGFNNALSSLRTLELITRGKEIRASANLFA